MGNLRGALWALLAAAIGLGILTGSAVAAEFSARMVTRDQSGEEASGRVFVKGQRIRQEITQEGQTLVTIIRLDRKVMWLIMDQEGAYMEMPLGRLSEDPSLVKGADPKRVRQLGTETINGIRCDKFQVTEEDGTVVTQWVSQELGWPIKGEVRSREGTWSHEYRDVRRGGVPDHLFEVPKGLKRMTVPGM